MIKKKKTDENFYSTLYVHYLEWKVQIQSSPNTCTFKLVKTDYSAS